MADRLHASPLRLPPPRRLAHPLGVVVLAAVTAAFLPRPVPAQEAPPERLQVESIRIVSGQIELTVHDLLPSDATYHLESSPGLGASEWTPETPQPEALGGDRWRFTLPRPADGRQFFRVAALRMSASPLTVRLSEVMTDNETALADEDGDFSDWVEIHNYGDAPVSLRQVGLADAVEDANPWPFPDRTLAPGAYLVVFASGKDRRPVDGELHADFRLRNGHEPVVLRDPAGRLLDRFLPPPQEADESAGWLRNAWLPYQGRLASPGAPNRDFLFGAPDPVLPVPWTGLAGGIYPGPVSLQLEADQEGAAIRYTLNGEEPAYSLFASNSTLYTGPLTLSQNTVLRARIFGPGNLRGRVITRTVLVGAEHTLPVVALTGDPANFEFRHGFLYGMGAALSAAGAVQGTFPYTNSNAWIDREAGANLELFEDGNPALNMGVGVKIFGGWGSRGYPQKSLAVFARRDYGLGSIPHRLFPDLEIDRFESFVLRNSGNDNQGTHHTVPRPPINAFSPPQGHGSYFVNSRFTLFRDAVLQRLLDGTGLDTQAYRPAVVYLNGDYWGIYNIREKTNEHYVAAHHGVSAGSVDLIEGYGAANAGSGAHYAAMRSFVGSRDMADPANYDKAGADYLDLANFTDYHLAVIYFQNFDIGNIKCWRSTEGDGRFRWIVYDQDYGFDLWPPEVYKPAMQRDYADYDNMFRFYTNPAGSGAGWPNEGGRTLLLRRLLANPDFRRDFILRCADLLNTRFAAGRVEGLIEEFSAALRPEMARHLQRWSWAGMQERGFGAPHKEEDAPLTVALWEENVAAMQAFGRRRPEELRGHLLDHFQLDQGTGELVVRLAPPHGGAVRVSTVTVEADGWTGTWFPAVPPPVEALASPGYRFNGWDGPVTENASGRTTVALQTGARTVLTGRFDRLEPVDPARLGVSVTELHYHPADDQEGDEWLELHHGGASAVSLGGWQLLDAEGNRYTFPALDLSPGQTAIVARAPEAFAAAYPEVAVPIVGGFGFPFGNGGDTVLLLDADGAWISGFTYGDRAPWPEAADGTGSTLELRALNLEPSDPASWQASPKRGGSPGRAPGEPEGAP